jgi:hypothetical protein
MSKEEKMPQGPLVQVGERDYELAVDETSAWVRIKEFSVYVQETDEGVCVDIYRDGDEMGPAIASTYAFDGESEREGQRALVSADFANIEARVLAALSLTPEQLGKPGSEATSGRRDASMSENFAKVHMVAEKLPRTPEQKLIDFCKMYGVSSVPVQSMGSDIMAQAAAVLGARDDREAEIAVKGFTQTTTTRIQDLYAHGDETTVYLVDRVHAAEAKVSTLETVLESTRRMLRAAVYKLIDRANELKRMDPERRCGSCGLPWNEHQDCDGYTVTPAAYCGGRTNKPFIEPGKTRDEKHE